MKVTWYTFEEMWMLVNTTGSIPQLLYTALATTAAELWHSIAENPPWTGATPAYLRSQGWRAKQVHITTRMPKKGRL